MPAEAPRRRAGPRTSSGPVRRECSRPPGTSFSRCVSEHVAVDGCACTRAKQPDGGVMPSETGVAAIGRAAHKRLRLRQPVTARERIGRQRYAQTCTDERSPRGRATVAPIQLDRCSAICRTCVHALSRTRSGRRCRRSCRLRRRRQGDHRDHRGNGTRQSIGPRTSPRTHARRRSRRMPFAGSLADGSGALPGAAARRTLGGHSHDTSERALCLPAGRQHPSLWPEHSVPRPCRGTLSPLAACDASRPLARRRRAPARRSRFDRRQTAQARPTGIGNLDPVPPRVLRHIHVGEHPGLLLQEATYPNGGVHGGHIAAIWKQDGNGYVLSLHFTEPTHAPTASWQQMVIRAADTMRP